jgi:hypothetical protein
MVEREERTLDDDSDMMYALQPDAPETFSIYHYIAIAFPCSIVFTAANEPISRGRKYASQAEPEEVKIRHTFRNDRRSLPASGTNGANTSLEVLWAALDS